MYCCPGGCGMICGCPVGGGGGVGVLYRCLGGISIVSKGFLHN